MRSLENEYLRELLVKKGIRYDGRKFHEYRKIEVEEGTVKKAEGSALASIGETKVLAGVKLELGEPYKDAPNEGVLKVNAELLPLASPEFEAGPPGEEAIELARVVDRVIRESGSIKLEELCIEEGSKAWCVFVDIAVINNDGNLLDAATVAAVAALKDAKVPKVEGDEVVRGEFERELPLQFRPLNVTVCKVGKKLLIDPTWREEAVVDAKVSFGIRDDGKVCAVQTYETDGLERSELEKMLRLALEKNGELRRVLGWR